MEKINNNLNNNCWFWSSIRIILEYVKNIGIPKELSNETIKKIITTKNINILEYDEITKKQSDMSDNLDGNAVEFLTVNGFYYTSCLPIRRIKTNMAELKINNELPFAFLIQLPCHFTSVILEDNEYYLYDQVGTNLYKSKLYFDKENNIIKIPVNPIYTNIYAYTIENNN